MVDAATYIKNQANNVVNYGNDISSSTAGDKSTTISFKEAILYATKRRALIKDPLFATNRTYEDIPKLIDSVLAVANERWKPETKLTSKNLIQEMEKLKQQANKSDEDYLRLYLLWTATAVDGLNSATKKYFITDNSMAKKSKIDEEFDTVFSGSSFGKALASILEIYNLLEIAKNKTLSNIDAQKNYLEALNKSIEFKETFQATANMFPEELLPTGIIQTMREDFAQRFKNSTVPTLSEIPKDITYKTDSKTIEFKKVETKATKTTEPTKTIVETNVDKIKALVALETTLANIEKTIPSEQLNEFKKSGDSDDLYIYKKPDITIIDAKLTAVRTAIADLITPPNDKNDAAQVLNYFIRLSIAREYSVAIGDQDKTKAIENTLAEIKASCAAAKETLIISKDKVTGFKPSYESFKNMLATGTTSKLNITSVYDKLYSPPSIQDIDTLGADAAAKAAKEAADAAAAKAAEEAAAKAKAAADARNTELLNNITKAAAEAKRQRVEAEKQAKIAIEEAHNPSAPDKKKHADIIKNATTAASAAASEAQKQAKLAEDSYSKLPKSTEKTPPGSTEKDAAKADADAARAAAESIPKIINLLYKRDQSDAAAATASQKAAEVQALTTAKAETKQEAEQNKQKAQQAAKEAEEASKLATTLYNEGLKQKDSVPDEYYEEVIEKLEQNKNTAANAADEARAAADDIELLLSQEAASKALKTAIDKRNAANPNKDPQKTPFTDKLLQQKETTLTDIAKKPKAEQKKAYDDFAATIITETDLKLAQDKANAALTEAKALRDAVNPTKDPKKTPLTDKLIQQKEETLTGISKKPIVDQKKAYDDFAATTVPEVKATLQKDTELQNKIKAAEETLSKVLTADQKQLNPNITLESLRPTPDNSKSTQQKALNEALDAGKTLRDLDKNNETLKAFDNSLTLFFTESTSKYKALKSLLETSPTSNATDPGNYSDQDKVILTSDGINIDITKSEVEVLSYGLVPKKTENIAEPIAGATLEDLKGILQPLASYLSADKEITDPVNITEAKNNLFEIYNTFKDKKQTDLSSTDVIKITSAFQKWVKYIGLKDLTQQKPELIRLYRSALSVDDYKKVQGYILALQKVQPYNYDLRASLLIKILDSGTDVNNDILQLTQKFISDWGGVMPAKTDAQSLSMAIKALQGTLQGTWGDTVDALCNVFQTTTEQGAELTTATVNTGWDKILLGGTNTSTMEELNKAFKALETLRANKTVSTNPMARLALAAFNYRLAFIGCLQINALEANPSKTLEDQLILALQKTIWFDEFYTTVLTILTSATSISPEDAQYISLKADSYIQTLKPFMQKYPAQKTDKTNQAGRDSLAAAFNAFVNSNTTAGQTSTSINLRSTTLFAATIGAGSRTVSAVLFNHKLSSQSAETKPADKTGFDLAIEVQSPVGVSPATLRKSMITLSPADILVVRAQGNKLYITGLDTPEQKISLKNEPGSIELKLPDSIDLAKMHDDTKLWDNNGFPPFTSKPDSFLSLKGEKTVYANYTDFFMAYLQQELTKGVNSPLLKQSFSSGNLNALMGLFSQTYMANCDTYRATFFNQKTQPQLAQKYFAVQILVKVLRGAGFSEENIANIMTNKVNNPFPSLMGIFYTAVLTTKKTTLEEFIRTDILTNKNDKLTPAASFDIYIKELLKVIFENTTEQDSAWARINQSKPK